MNLLFRHWKTAADIAQLRARSQEVQRKISMSTFKEKGGTEEEWTQTTEATESFALEQSYKLDQEICNKQAEFLISSEQSLSKAQSDQEKSWFKLFITSKLALGVIETGAGRRSTSDPTRRRPC